jgi:hypothetical protein
MIIIYEERKKRNGSCKKYRNKVVGSDTKQERCLKLGGEIHHSVFSISPQYHKKL